jgi:hypothetical protein
MRLFCPQCQKTRNHKDSIMGVDSDIKGAVCNTCGHFQPVNSVKSTTKKGTKDMFGDNDSAITNSSGNNSSILKSGYDPTQVKGGGKLRGDFTKALDFDPEQAKESSIREAAKQNGKYKALAHNVKRLSKEKLGSAKGIHEVYDAVLDHAVGAAKLELGWQQSTQRGLEELSPLLLDMDIHQEQHSGFAEYLDKADKLLKF